MTRRSTHMVLAATSVLSLGLWTGCGDNQSAVPQNSVDPVPAPATSGGQVNTEGDGGQVSNEATAEANGGTDGNSSSVPTEPNGTAGSNQANQSAAQEQVSPTPASSPIIIVPTPTPTATPIVGPTATPIIVPTATPTATPFPTASPTAAPSASPTSSPRPSASPSATPHRRHDHDRDDDHDGRRDDDYDEDSIAGSSVSSQLHFPPAAIQIRAGEKVTWTNSGSFSYIVMADPNKVLNPSDVSLPSGAEPFVSGDIEPGQRFTKTFNVPGTYKYFSKSSSGTAMTSTITVSP